MTKELQTDQDSYKVVDSSMLDKKGHSFQGGRYVGKSPKKAAAKAAKRLLNLAADDKAEFGQNKSLDHVVFKLQQTTRGSDHKEYIYKAKKMKGKVEMVTIKIAGSTLQVPKSSNIEVDAADEAELLQAIKEAKAAKAK
jgi:hypothetical protein